MNHVQLGAPIEPVWSEQSLNLFNTYLFLLKKKKNLHTWLLIFCLLSFYFPHSLIFLSYIFFFSYLYFLSPSSRFSRLSLLHIFFCPIFLPLLSFSIILTFIILPFFIPLIFYLLFLCCYPSFFFLVFAELPLKQAWYLQNFHLRKFSAIMKSSVKRVVEKKQKQKTY